MIGTKREIEIKEPIEKKSDEPFKIKFEFMIVPQKEKQTVTIIVE